MKSLSVSCWDVTKDAGCKGSGEKFLGLKDVAGTSLVCLAFVASLVLFAL